ncbi:MAG: hypothetical protein Q4F30_03545 [Akkermansia sp.]|nr:hypothetical protein [Akkermansia sp.]
MRYNSIAYARLKKKLSSKPKARKCKGFALIATLTLMMLLALLSVGILAMTASQNRVSMQEVLQAQARQQALVGLDAAVAQLQIELGPDQRVSASSAILSEEGSAPGSHLLGVWNSFDGPIYGKSLSGKGRIQSTYSNHRSSMFRRWLISSNEPEDTRSINAASQLSARKPGKRICLVGEGTLGNRVSPSEYVYADMIPMPALSKHDPNTGLYAWWVCGENQKAKVGLKEPEKTSDPVEVLHRTWNTPSAKFAADSELNFLPEQADRPERVLTMPSLPLLAGTTKPAGMPYFFDATVSSYSLPTNARTGGLKQDLCLLFNKKTLTDTEYACRSSQDCPIAEGEDVPKGTEDAMPIGSWQNLYAYYNCWPDGSKTDDAFAARLQGSLNGNLFTRMSGSATDDTGASLPSPDTNGRKSYFDSRSLLDSGTSTASGYARTPVMLAFVSSYAMAVSPLDPNDPHTQATSGGAIYTMMYFYGGTREYWTQGTPHGAFVSYAPLVLWWNPYNVPMRVSGKKLWAFSVPFRQIWLRKHAGQIVSDFWDEFHNQEYNYAVLKGDTFGVDGGDYFQAEGGGNGEIVFQPGEILFFSPSAARTDDKKDMVHCNPWSVGCHVNAISGYRMGAGNYLPFNSLRTADGSRPGRYCFQLGIGLDTYEPGARDYSGNYVDPHGWKLAPGHAQAFTVVSGYGGMSESNNVPATDEAALDDKAGMSPQRMLLDWISPEDGRREEFNDKAINVANPRHCVSIPISELDTFGEFMNDPKMPYFVTALGVVAKSSNTNVDTRIYPEKDFRTKIWQHSSPAFWGSALLEPDDQTRRYHPYQLAMLSTSGGMSASPLDNVGNNGLLGITSDGEQVSYASVLELPVHPPFSLAGFAGMRLQPGWYKASGNDKVGVAQLRRMQYQAGVPGVGIGNSFADPCIPAGDVYAYFEQKEMASGVTGNTHIFGDFFDHALLINDNLWDSWFCSSVSDMPSSSNKVKAEDTLAKFMSNTEQLPVARYKKTNTPYRDQQVIARLMGGDGWKYIAEYLMIDGGFNVNSVSVPAWTATLQGLAKRKLVCLKDGKLALVEPGKSDDEVLFSRFMASTTDKSLDSLGGYSVMEGSSQLRKMSNSMASAWGEVRKLDESSIARLAEEMVKQVRKRGPFLSMSDFINRRLDSEGGEEALKGALQAAIDATDINAEFNEVMLSSPDAGKLFKFPKADEGSMHTAAPGYLIQSDVLASLGNILTVRDDTFTVRAYGCVRAADKRVLAQAWCEATVQRTIDYVSPVNAPSVAEYKSDGTRDKGLTEVNRRLGRKMRVVAFKWLDAWDI